MAEKKEVYAFQKRIRDFRSAWEDFRKENFFFEISMLEQGEQDKEQETFQITLSDELMKKFIQERTIEIVKAIERNHDLQSEKGKEKEQELLKIRGKKITTEGEFGLASISHIFSAIQARRKKEIEEKKSQILEKIKKKIEKVLSFKQIVGNGITYRVFYRRNRYFVNLKITNGQSKMFKNFEMTITHSSGKKLGKIMEDKIEEICIILNLKK